MFSAFSPPPPKHVNTNILLPASSHREAASHSKGRESPLGAEREREFPTTKIGGGAELFLFLHFFPRCEAFFISSVCFFLFLGAEPF